MSLYYYVTDPTSNEDIACKAVDGRIYDIVCASNQEPIYDNVYEQFYDLVYSSGTKDIDNSVIESTRSAPPEVYEYYSTYLNDFKREYVCFQKIPTKPTIKSRILKKSLSLLQKVFNRNIFKCCCLQ